MDEKKNHTILIVSIIVVIGVLVSLIGGCVGGGLAGYLLAQRQSEDLRDRVSRLEATGILDWSDLLPEFQELVPALPELLDRLRGLEERGGVPEFEYPDEFPPFDEDLFPFPMWPGDLDGGAWVQEVIEDTPAEAAGVQANDLIVAVDDLQVDEIHPLEAIIGSHQPGDRIELTILREDEEISLTVRLGEHPDDPESAYLGVYFVPLTMQWEFDQEFAPDQQQPRG